MVTSSTSAPVEDAANAGDLPERQPAIVVLFWRFARGYFHAERRWLRRASLAGLLALSGVQTFIQVRVNLWNVDFFNALGLFHQAFIFVGWIAASVAVAVLQLHMRMNLQVAWRRWLTRDLIARWVDSGRHYQLKFMAGDHDNPDQRLADDVHLAAECAIDFGMARPPAPVAGWPACSAAACASGGKRQQIQACCEIDYRVGLVVIRFVGTHSEYDRIDVTTV